MNAENYDIVGSYNNQRVSNIDSERSVNCFEYQDMLGKKNKSLIGTSGLINTNISFGTTTGGFRAQFLFNNFTYNVIGTDIYQINTSGGTTKIGTLTTNSGYVGIDANTYQILFVDGQNGWIWDTIANTFVQIIDSGFPTSPLDCCYLDGFFIVINGNTNNFFLSELNNGLIWSGYEANIVSASAATNTFTLSSATQFQTGVPLEFVAPSNVDNFTADSTTDLLTLTSTTNYLTGTPVKLTNSGGGLPAPLVAGTEYYVINISGTTIKLATSYANSISGTAIDITTNGTGTQSIQAQLPDGVLANTTYYAIHTSTTTIKIATTAANAYTGTAITLLSNGGPSTQILNNGELQQGSVTSHPGTLVACRTLHRRIFFFSQFFTEVWENAGIGTNLPFRRNNSLLMEYGTPSVGSVAVGFDKMFFLSQDRDGLGAVMEVEGTQSAPVSTRALDFQLAQYATLGQVADCRAFLIKENGLIFYRMNFTAANHTFVYNVTQSNPSSDATKYWHEEEVLNGDRHPAQTHVYFHGQNYVGNYESPTLYIISPNTYTNDGEVIRRMRITKPIVPSGYNRTRIDRLQIDAIQGSISSIPIQPNFSVDPPYLFVSISKDGGNSYGYRYKLPMGLVGQRTYRAVTRKLGVIPRGQAFITKTEFFSPIPFTILGAAWAYEVLPE